MPNSVINTETYFCNYQMVQRACHYNILDHKENLEHRHIVTTCFVYMNIKMSLNNTMAIS